MSGSQRVGQYARVLVCLQIYISSVQRVKIGNFSLWQNMLSQQNKKQQKQISKVCEMYATHLWGI